MKRNTTPIPLAVAMIILAVLSVGLLLYVSRVEPPDIAPPADTIPAMIPLQ